MLVECLGNIRHRVLYTSIFCETHIHLYIFRFIWLYVKGQPVNGMIMRSVFNGVYEMDEPNRQNNKVLHVGAWLGKAFNSA